MAIPDFVKSLRAKIGRDPLPLVGVIAVVLDEQGRVLLVRRADNHKWTLVTGIVDPGEQPAAAVVREVEEETGVTAEVERLVAIEARDLATLVNGDQVWWTGIGFRCRYVAGQARVNDDESTDVRWFDLTTMPELPEHQARCLGLALADDPAAWFERPSS